jgi:uncharacterized protein YgiM (DUF1202 family)
VVFFCLALYHSVADILSEKKNTSTYVAKVGFKIPSLTFCPTMVNGPWKQSYKNLVQDFQDNPWVNVDYGNDLGDTET